MKVLQVYNQYRSPFNGEEAVVLNTIDLIRRRGGQVRLFGRTSRGLDRSWRGRVRAFFSGLYSLTSRRAMRAILRDDRPDVVHLHNVYPLISPSVLGECRRAGVPVVMTVHNQGLTCPRADHLYQGRLCEKCLGGREYHCALQNCRGDLFESVAYALRSTAARKMRFFHDGVTRFIALGAFGRQRLALAGFDPERIDVLPNMVAERPDAVDPAAGSFVAFAGRLSPEKGIDVLLEAAARLPHVPVRLAGAGPLRDELLARKPANVTLVGRLEAAEMERFYREARCVVLPSIAYEMCPLVLTEAMSHGLPTITTQLGGQQELVDDGLTGLLVPPNDPAALAVAIDRLWTDDGLCRRMGRAAHERVRRFGEDRYYDGLMGIYRRAITEAGGRSDGSRGRVPTPLQGVST